MIDPRVELRSVIDEHNTLADLGQRRSEVPVGHVCIPIGLALTLAEPPLTDDERAVIRTLGDVWNRLCEIAGHGASREADLAEAALHIHALQRMVGSHAAARAYPGSFRPLGETLQEQRSRRAFDDGCPPAGS